MAITFNPSTKIIQLDSFITSEKELWIAFVDWSVQSDNLKYWIGMTQLGWFEPIALYIYLELWWKIRPVEADWITTISWNLLVQDWGSPIVATIWSYQTLVNMETPVKAVAIETSSWSWLSTEEHNKLMTMEDEVWTRATRTLTDWWSSWWATPQEIWEYNTRSLTEWAWLDETELHTALDTYANKDWYKADVSNLSADVNIVEVKWVPITDIDDFKATTTISSNMRGTDNANTVVPDNTTIGLIKTKVDTLNNYDETWVNIKLDSIEGKINIVDTNVDDIETKVNTLNNYNDTWINIKLDSIQADTDILQTNLTDVETILNSVKDDTAYQERMIFIDTELVAPGDWTAKTPFNSFTNALDFAEVEWIRKIILYSDTTIDRNLKNFVIIWVWTPILDCNWQNLDKSEFSRLVMRWIYTWYIVVHESILDNNFRLCWYFEKCALNWDLICIWQVLLANSFSNIAWLSRPSLSVDWNKVSVRGYSWWIDIKDCDNIVSEITVEISQGKVWLTSTCTAGIISVRWNATLDDQSTAWCTVDITALINQELTERTARASHKIEWTQLVVYDDRWEIARWNLSDINSTPSNTNVYNRITI